MPLKPWTHLIYVNQNSSVIADLIINTHCSYYSQVTFLSDGRCSRISGFVSTYLYFISFPLSWTHDSSGLEEHTEFQTVADSYCIQG